MAKGFLKGVFWGATVSVSGAAILSLLAEPPRWQPAEIAVAPATVAPDTPIETAPIPAARPEPSPEVDTPPVVNDPIPEAQSEPAPQVDLPVAPEQPEVDATDTTEQASDLMPGSAEQPDPGPPTVTFEEAPAEETPAVDAAPAIAAEATLPAPEPAPEMTAEADATPAPENEAPETPAPETAAVETPAIETPEQGPEMQPEASPQVSDVAPELPAIQPEGLPEPANEEPKTAEVADLPQASDTSKDVAPHVGTPAGNLIENRRAAEVPLVATDGPGPLTTDAVPFEASENLPLLSIIMIDDRTGALGPDVLRDFPYPVSIAVDASSANATDRMQAWRDAGFEVLALTALPAGAKASDVETTLTAARGAVPRAVAVIEDPDASFQQSRAISDQVLSTFSGPEQGLVLQAKGLNTAQKIAARTGAPVISIFRDLDGKDQTADVIRRFLDNAAFRARQEEGGVTVLTRLRPETLSALLLWGLQDRASTVSIAPVSALLKGAMGDG